MRDNFTTNAPHMRVDDDDADLSRGTRTMGRVLLALVLLVLGLIAAACL